MERNQIQALLNQNSIICLTLKVFENVQVANNI